MSIHILLVDDHKIFREGIRALLEKEPNFVVVGEAQDGREAVELAKEKRPDIVIMDVSMPRLSGPEATRQIIAACPDVRIVCLSMFAEQRFITAALEAGAKGYVLKDCSWEEVAQAIQAVHDGQTYLCPRIAGVALEGFRARQVKPDLPSHGRLSPREREIVQLLAEGYSTKEIANQLHVSVKTVNTHREHIMEKLKLESLAAIIKYAIREGITTMNE
ncbi:MAG: response regulator transcription factor [Nitrospirota bacterium]|nr:MAG: response regulator transcription factor [Nitrospirota bacterium]